LRLKLTFYELPNISSSGDYENQHVAGYSSLFQQIGVQITLFLIDEEQREEVDNAT